jgi:selenocysteine-specific elongation factor
MVMARRSVVIGTAGHIDHGKTALIRALTGVDCDRLMEEKRRGITIDLGFASLNVTAEDHTPLRISFVDVPGHKGFIRNMLAGAGCVAAVLLVISAEEGIKPQTEEHLAICSLLGIRRGIVAITKVDLVSPERLRDVTAKVVSFLADSFLGQSNAAILPVSALTGAGLEDLSSALVALSGGTSIRYPDALLRLPLDRAFVMKGFGTVVTGTLLSGVLQTGQSLVLEPGGRAVRVRGIQTHNCTEDQAHAGSRVALNLSGIDAAEIARGQTVVEQQSLSAVALMDVEVTLLSGAAGLKHRALVHFHVFTSETVATVSLYTYALVKPGERRLLRLKLSQPIVIVPGDRFVLRQASPAATIGGGRVLDAHPLQNLRKARRLAWLKKLQDAPVEQQLLLRVDRRGNAGIEYRDLMLEMGLQREALQRFAKPMIQRGTLIEVSNELLVTQEQIQSVTESVLTCIKADKHNTGLKRSEVRSHLRLSAQVVDFVLARLTANGKLTVAGERFYSMRADASTPAAQSTTLSVIADTFRLAGLATPLAAEVASRVNLSDADMRRHMTLLLREGVIVKMGNNEVYIHRDALLALRLQLAGWRGKTIDVSGFKDLTGLTRKHAIPLLEYLDRERVTQKVGDRRMVL